jgi:hypothetical protein
LTRAMSLRRLSKPWRKSIGIPKGEPQYVICPKCERRVNRMYIRDHYAMMGHKGTGQAVEQRGY